MTIFVVGQKVRILDDRRTEGQPSHELTIIAVKPINEVYRQVAAHDQEIVCDDNNTYSGYWFDPECKVLDRLKNLE